MILDPMGRLVWFHPLPKGEAATNFQVQNYQGQPVLVWWEGEVPARLGVGFGRDEIVNSAYKLVATVNAGNGYQADLHDFQITPQGSAYLTAYSLVSADLSSAGGPGNGILQDAIAQEVDIRTGLVMFEWHAYGHVALYDSYSHAPRYSNEPFDFFHINSISPDPWGDGNFIVSSRNTWAAYEIDHVSGAVQWRLGGRHSSFKMGPGTGTAWQHDVRWQPDRTLTIFDNGSVPKVHSQSRIIRERIDWAHRKVTLVSRYIGGISAGSQGNDQVLPNGNSFIGWGEEPFMTEFAPTGQVLFSARFPRPGPVIPCLPFPLERHPRIATGDCRQARRGRRRDRLRELERRHRRHRLAASRGAEQLEPGAVATAPSRGLRPRSRSPEQPSVWPCRRSGRAEKCWPPRRAYRAEPALGWPASARRWHS